jgi:hypothetical protein
MSRLLCRQVDRECGRCPIGVGWVSDKLLFSCIRGGASQRWWCKQRGRALYIQDGHGRCADASALGSPPTITAPAGWCTFQGQSTSLCPLCCALLSVLRRTCPLCCALFSVLRRSCLQNMSVAASKVRLPRRSRQPQTLNKTHRYHFTTCREHVFCSGCARACASRTLSKSLVQRLQDVCS